MIDIVPLSGQRVLSGFQIPQLYTWDREISRDHLLHLNLISSLLVFLILLVLLMKAHNQMKVVSFGLKTSEAESREFEE